MSKEEFRALVLRMVVHRMPMGRAHFAMSDETYRKVLDEMAVHDAVLAEMLRKHHAAGEEIVAYARARTDSKGEQL
jgi:hypothetical protein